MKCQDCIHCELCKNIIEHYIEFFGDDRVETHCDHFKDKSQMVELPCAVGLTVYYLLYYEICEAVITNIEINYYTTPKIWLTVEYNSHIVGKHSYKSRIDLMLGKSVFLTKSEAENALAKNHQK